MSEDRQARLQAGRLLARDLAKPAMRRSLARDGFGASNSIVVALDDDLLEVVLRRIQASPPPGVVAIYTPGETTLRIMGIAPGVRDMPAADGGVGGKTTIGMLFDYVSRQKRRRFHFSVGDSSTMPHADANDLLALAR